jgi:hypothetical protein
MGSDAGGAALPELSPTASVVATGALGVPTMQHLVSDGLAYLAAAPTSGRGRTRAAF